MLVRHRAAIDAAQQCLRRRITIVSCSCPCFLDNHVRLRPELLQFLTLESADFFQCDSEAAYWLAKLPRSEIILALHAHIFVFTMPHVTSPPLCHELQEPWSFACSDRFDCLA